MEEYNIKELLNLASTGQINLNDYISKDEFKQKLYDYIQQNGIEYADFRAIVANVGEEKIIESLDIQNLASQTNGDRVFTVLLENGNTRILDEITKKEELRDVFISNLDKNYGTISQSYSQYFKKIVDSLNKENSWPKNAAYLVSGLTEKDKRDITMNNYNKEIIVDVLSNAENEVVEDYLKFNPKALDTVKEVGIVRLAEKGVQFPPKITSQKEFFESIKASNMKQFRKNINHVYRTSYSPVLEGRIKSYEKNILDSFNKENGVLSLYDLDNPEAVENILQSKDGFIADYDVRKELGIYLTSKTNMDSKFSNYQNILRERLNLNIDVNSIDTLEIEGISDDEEITQSLYRLKENVIRMKEELRITREKVEKNLSQISNSKFDEVLPDYLFSDTKNNVEINIDEMLSYDKSLGEDSVFSKEKTSMYEKIKNISNLSSKDKKELYDSLKDKDMVSELYQDFSNLRKKSYDEINKVLYKSAKGDNISLNKTEELGVEAQELKGEPFYMLVRVVNNEFKEETNKGFSCYSLISDKNLNVFENGRGTFLYGYDNIDPNLIENVFESDSYTMTGTQNKTDRPNRIMRPKDIVESDSSYSEINIKNIKNEKDGKSYKEMKPSYIVCMDKEPSKELLEEAKRLNIPITMIDRQRYKDAHYKKNEYKEYDSDIN